MNNVFVTGPPRSGKSTLISQLLEELDLKVEGIRTPDICEDRRRVGFKLMDIATGEQGVLAHVEQDKGPKLRKYRVCMEDLEKFTEKSLKGVPEDTELMVIDEIGKMEMFSEKFVQAVEDLLKRDLPVLAVLHRHLLDRYQGYGEVYRLEKGNYERVKERVSDEIVDITR